MTYLAKHEIPLGELHKHLLSAKCIVELELEVFDLEFRVTELDQRFFVIGLEFIQRSDVLFHF